MAKKYCALGMAAIALAFIATVNEDGFRFGIANANEETTKGKAALVEKTTLKVAAEDTQPSLPNGRWRFTADLKGGDGPPLKFAGEFDVGDGKFSKAFYYHGNIFWLSGEIRDRTMIWGASIDAKFTQFTIGKGAHGRLQSNWKYETNIKFIHERWPTDANLRVKMEPLR